MNESLIHLLEVIFLIGCIYMFLEREEAWMAIFGFTRPFYLT